MNLLPGPQMSVVEILCRARLAQLGYPGWVIPDGLDDYSRMLDGEYIDPVAYTATAKGSDNG